MTFIVYVKDPLYFGVARVILNLVHLVSSQVDLTMSTDMFFSHL